MAHLLLYFNQFYCKDKVFTSKIIYYATLCCRNDLINLRYNYIVVPIKSNHSKIEKFVDRTTQEIKYGI